MEAYKYPQLLKLKEVSERTSMSLSALYLIIRAGDLKTVHIGRSVRILESEMERWMNSFSIEDSREQK